MYFVLQKYASLRMDPLKAEMKLRSVQKSQNSYVPHWLKSCIQTPWVLHYMDGIAMQNMVHTFRAPSIDTVYSPEVISYYIINISSFGQGTYIKLL